MNTETRHGEMTQRQLEESAKELSELVNSKDATPAQAERLAEIRRQLRRMNCIRTGKSW